MKTKIILLIVSTLFFTTGTAFSANTELSDNDPVIGIGLDTTPLPELLVKHLGLKPGQGVRISNIMVGSAADEAGLEQDDIIISFQGQDVYDSDALSNAVQQSGVGAEVTLEIIHLGQRQTVELKLKALTETSGWKYPDEPQIEQYWQLGRIFRVGPDEQDWMQVPEDQLPGEFKTYINTFFNELYSSQYFSDGQKYSITIEGSPDKGDSKITVDIDGDQYETTLDNLDKLPDKHREVAEQAIENARNKKSVRIRITPRFRDDSENIFQPRLRLKDPLPNVPDDFANSFSKRMEEQMRQMEERMKELESYLNRLIEKEKEN